MAKKLWKTVGVLYPSTIGKGFYGFVSPTDWAEAAQLCEELENGCIPISLFPNENPENDVAFNMKVGVPIDVKGDD